ncbi:hypothetical protein [Streptomyces globisporus]|uniref:hypothetical protein n=1 Tax=Streptomyces globisporus TaxID=1908 RepID=UPI002FF9D0E4
MLPPGPVGGEPGVPLGVGPGVRLARRVGHQDQTAPARRRHRQGGGPDALAVQARRALRAVRLLAQQQRAVGGGVARTRGPGRLRCQAEGGEGAGEGLGRCPRGPGRVDDHPGADRRAQRVSRHGPWSRVV